MSTGFLTPAREPALPVEVRGPDGAQSFEAIVDTGFNGSLTLRPAWIDSLGLPPAGKEPVTLADGREITTSLYDAYAILGETAYKITVAEAAATPLLGTDLLWGFSLYVEFQSGGAVEVKPLSEEA
jgi:clan AA aspartic protease